MKGGLRQGTCPSDKQALQTFLRRFQLDDTDVVLYKGTKLHIPAAELWKELVLDGARCIAPVTSTNMAGGTCSAGLVQLCIVVSTGRIGVTATRLFCALVFPSVGQDLRNNQTKGGHHEGFCRAYLYHPFVLLSSCRELICGVRASRACPSKPLDKNQSLLEIPSQAFHRVDLLTTTKPYPGITGRRILDLEKN